MRKFTGSNDCECVGVPVVAKNVYVSVKMLMIPAIIRAVIITEAVD